MRLAVVVEDDDLPAIVFKDIYNNLIAHSGKGAKTGMPFASIYVGYNMVRFAVSEDRLGGLKNVVAHEIRDVSRGYHVDIDAELEKGLIGSEEAVSVKKFYEDTLDFSVFKKSMDRPEKDAKDRGIKISDVSRNFLEVLGEKIVKRIVEEVNTFLKVVFEKVAARERPLILALDMDIGNLKEHAIPFITQLQRDCERRGLGDIYFVRGAAGELEGNIIRKVSDLAKRGLITDIRDVDIVLVGRKANMENKCYQTLEGEESFTMVNIDDAAISELNYVPLPEILAFAVAVAAGQDNTALSRLYEKITGSSIPVDSIDAMKRSKQFTIKLPQTDPVDYNVLKKMYELARACLAAA